jgi:Universal stress protein family
MAYPIKTILVPMQLDDPDAAALRVAIRLARESDAAICAMHIVPEDPRAIAPGASSSEMFARDLEKAKEDLQRVAGQHLAGVKHTTPHALLSLWAYRNRRRDNPGRQRRER